jgi:hypothetical protein
MQSLFKTFLIFQIKGFHAGKNVDCGLVVCDAMLYCRWLPKFQTNILPHLQGVFYPEDRCGTFLQKRW